LDLKEIEKAAEAAVGRGVDVRAIIAHTHSGPDKRLRQLEQRMLDKGVTVSRSKDDLVRYHGKMLIADREELHVYGFNYTSDDMRSRSFGVVTTDRQIVQEAGRLFDADTARQEFQPSISELVVSPENAREELASFIKRAKKSLAIYDPKLTDTQMIRLLQLRMKSGVDLRIIGKVGRRAGSQSLRALELDARREVGIIVRDAKIVKRLQEVFDADWAKTELGRKEVKEFEKDQKLEESAAAIAVGE
jgi:phosphatidylserine/phosphatidylglycerophosphate/cardiolipin synthase-like enzyme